MAALVRGEDLLVREVQDVPYVVLVVGGEDTKCPICHLVFMTPYQLREHMDVHRGEQFPCGNCSKLLASCRMLKAHQKGCIQGSKFICEECGWEYATKQGLRQHIRVTHGPEQPAPDEVFICPFCAKQFGVKKSMREHITTCSQNPAKKGPFFCWVEGCKSCHHPFSRMKNWMPIWPPVMAGKNNFNKLHQDYLSGEGTGHLGGHLAGCLAVFHVCFHSRLAGCCACASYIYLLVHK